MTPLLALPGGVRKLRSRSSGQAFPRLLQDLMRDLVRAVPGGQLDEDFPVFLGEVADADEAVAGPAHGHDDNSHHFAADVRFELGYDCPLRVRIQCSAARPSWRSSAAAGASGASSPTPRPTSSSDRPLRKPLYAFPQGNQVAQTRHRALLHRDLRGHR